MANILYTSHCPMCMVVEHKLKESNIPYEVCDLRTSPSDVLMLEQHGIKSLPVMRTLSEDGNERFMTPYEILNWILDQSKKQDKEVK